MTTKTLTITQEAYDSLAREKRSEESFSELFLRLTKDNGTLSDCLGLWEDVSDVDMRAFDEVKRSWDQSDKDQKRRLGKI